jgi:drug/metabolite transporter (DMT)-like permease
MTTAAVGLALGAALLHAAWNLRLKASADPLRVAAVAVPLGTAVLTPIILGAWLATGRPGLPLQAWALAALAGFLELLYFHALSNAYRRGEISAVYPVARGTAPLLAAFVGLAALHERLTTIQMVGVAVLLVGIWLARPSSDGQALVRGSRSALAPALLTGVLIAGYTIVDRLGVRLGPFWLYAWAHFTATALWLLPWARRGLLRAAMPVGVLSVGAYGLALTALSLAPLALVAPVRESGVIVVALWGVLRMGERDRASLKVGGAAAVLAGAALLAAG